MSKLRRTVHARVAAIAAVASAAFVVAALVPLSSAADPSLSQLNSALSATQAHAQALSGERSQPEWPDRLARLADHLRPAARGSRPHRARRRTRPARPGHRVAVPRAAAAGGSRSRAWAGPARCSRSSSSPATRAINPDLVSIILESRGFQDLLDKIQYLQQRRARAERVDRGHPLRQGAGRQRRAAARRP